MFFFFPSVMKWVQGCIGRMLHCTPPEIYKIIPIVSIHRLFCNYDNKLQEVFYFFSSAERDVSLHCSFA